MSANCLEFDKETEQFRRESHDSEVMKKVLKPTAEQLTLYFPKKVKPVQNFPQLRSNFRIFSWKNELSAKLKIIAVHYYFCIFFAVNCIFWNMTLNCWPITMQRNLYDQLMQIELTFTLRSLALLHVIYSLWKFCMMFTSSSEIGFGLSFF